MNIISFFISSLIIVLIPGTGVIYTISTGFTKGKKSSIFASIGCTIGIIPHLCLSTVLSSILLQMGNQIFVIVKIAGALYLLYLGIWILISRSKITFEHTAVNLNSKSIVQRGILINLLNPKLTIFFFSFLPQYIGTYKKNYISQCFILGLTFMVITLIVFIGYGFLAGSAKAYIEQSPRKFFILQKCFGLIFVVFALQLGLSTI